MRQPGRSSASFAHRSRGADRPLSKSPSPRCRNPTGRGLRCLEPRGDDRRETLQRGAMRRRSGPTAPTRHLTIMACSMVGSMALSARLGTRGHWRFESPLSTKCRRCWSRFDGFVGQYLARVCSSISATRQLMNMTRSRPCAPALPSSTLSAGESRSDVTVQARVGIATGWLSLASRRDR